MPWAERIARVCLGGLWGWFCIDNQHVGYVPLVLGALALGLLPWPWRKHDAT